MCPDNELLSAYIDGELDKKWELKISEHLTNCINCKQVIGEYKKQKDFLSSVQDIDIVSSKIKVWQSVNRNIRKDKPGLWKKRFNLSLPSLAGATAVIFALSFFMYFSGNQQGINTATKQILSELNLPDGINSIEDYQAFIQLQGRILEFDFEMPSSTVFRINSEPAIIKATDNSRRNK